ncbi:hypothetical protein YB2330_004339 [Saitoella coloradoensis]
MSTPVPTGSIAGGPIAPFIAAPESVPPYNSDHQNQSQSQNVKARQPQERPIQPLDQAAMDVAFKDDDQLTYNRSGTGRLDQLHIQDFEMSRLRSLWTRAGDNLPNWQGTAYGGKIRVTRATIIQPRGVFALAKTLFVSLLPWIQYVQQTTRNVIMTFLSTPFMWLTDPVQVVMMLVGYPVVATVLFWYELVLKAFHILGGKRWFKHLSDTYGAGLSVVNWSEPDMFTMKYQDVVVRAKDNLSKLNSHPAIKQYLKAHDGFHPEFPVFDIDIARFLLLVSSIMYERDDKKVHEASREYKRFRRLFPTLDPVPHLGVDHPAATMQTPDMGEQPIHHDLQTHIEGLFEASVKRLQRQAELWSTPGAPIGFATVSELNTTGSPFAALWWREGDHPFIVVSFKGTSPGDFSEWITDATFQKTRAGAYLFGDVHTGFYDSLFPDSSGQSTRAYNGRLGLANSPYGSIVSAVRRKAQQLARGIPVSPRTTGHVQRHVPVWVTGHSLGAAIASLFYARVMKSIDAGHNDLGSDAFLRDAYVYGCPAVGDSDFAEWFASISSTPFDNPRALWRIIDDSDLVTRVPFSPQTFVSGGWGSAISLVSAPLVKRDSLADYTVIGPGIRVFQDAHKEPLGWNPVGHPSDDVDAVTLHSAIPREAHAIRSKIFSTPQDISRQYVGWVRRVMQANPAQLLVLLTPKPLRDHFTTEYWRALERSAHFFSEHDSEKEKIRQQQYRRILEKTQ